MRINFIPLSLAGSPLIFRKWEYGQLGGKREGRRALKVYWQVGRPIILWTLFSLLVSVTFVEVFGRTVETTIATIWTFLLGIALLVALIIPLATVFLVLRRIFKPEEKRKHIVIILLSYISLIICFGGSYYTMSAFSDRVDAREKHAYYEQKANYVDPFGKIVVRRDSRAFSGINTRLWSGVDWPDYKGNQLRNEQRSPVSPADMILAAGKPLDKISNFQFDDRPSVFAATLYFSVVNMTTLGFGDIAPKTWFARLAANIQVLTGLVLFYFGISMVIGNWWADMTDTTDQKAGPGH